MIAADVDPTYAFLADPGFSVFAGFILWGLLLGAFLLFFRAGR